VKRKDIMEPGLPQEYYATSMPRRCPVCGSDKLVLDIARGQVVCTSCGYVVDELVFEMSTPSTHRPDLSRQASRTPSVERRAAAVQLSLTTARLRLASRIGHDAEFLLESLRSDPTTAQKALHLLRNPCIKRKLRKLSPRLGVAVLHALLLYTERGEYPLYSEIEREYEIDEADARKLRRMLRRLIRCIGEETKEKLMT
jgi:transcription initiation factor TFIIIB Brf1 subunit/transcription initiation factor TFIIB